MNADVSNSAGSSSDSTSNSKAEIETVEMRKGISDELGQNDVHIKTEPSDYEDYTENRFDSETDIKNRRDSSDKEKRDSFSNEHDVDLSAIGEHGDGVRKQLDLDVDSGRSNKRTRDNEFLSFRHSLGILPGPFAVSLVDRNHDPSLTIVFHCWICDAQFLDKLGIIQHLKVT